MTKQQLEKRVKELESRIAELQHQITDLAMRPPVLIQPYFPPPQPVQPFPVYPTPNTSPWMPINPSYPIITCCETVKSGQALC